MRWAPPRVASCRSTPERGTPEDHRLQGREVLHHPARALAPDAGGLDPAEGDVIEPEVGRPVDDQPADIELSRGLEHAADVAGEEPALQPVGGRVRLPQGVPELVER